MQQTCLDGAVVMAIRMFFIFLSPVITCFDFVILFPLIVSVLAVRLGVIDFIYVIFYEFLAGSSMQDWCKHFLTQCKNKFGALSTHRPEPKMQISKVRIY
jgi:hypothetical protein